MRVGLRRERARKKHCCTTISSVRRRATKWTKALSIISLPLYCSSVSSVWSFSSALVSSTQSERTIILNSALAYSRVFSLSRAAMWTGMKEDETRSPCAHKNETEPALSILTMLALETWPIFHSLYIVHLLFVRSIFDTRKSLGILCILC